MKILITGSNGLLGQKLVSLLAPKEEITLLATSRGANRITYLDVSFDYQSLEVTNQDEVYNTVSEFKPDVIIHTAAMTNVDQCETEREECWRLNVDAVQYLADASVQNNSFLLHLSTDFIFDGADGPYKEEDVANPISYYGDSKLAAEEILIKSNLRWAIARTVLVYGITPGMSRSNIILWVKKSLEDKKDIKVVTDQWRTPTLAEDLAMGCYLIAKNRAEGVFNISGKDMLTPYDMAILTADYFGLDKSYMTKADSSTFSQPAKRPPKTGFDISKAENELGYTPKSFEQGIEIMENQLQEYAGE